MITSVFASAIEHCLLQQNNHDPVPPIHKSDLCLPCILPCTTGCAYYKRGRCASHQRLKKVPPNFESLVVSSIRDHMWLSVLAMHLTASAGIHAGMLPFMLHLLASDEDPLQIHDGNDMWDYLKKHYPAKGGGIDDSKLAEAIRQKLKEISLS